MVEFLDWAFGLLRALFLLPFFIISRQYRKWKDKRKYNE